MNRMNSSTFTAPWRRPAAAVCVAVVLAAASLLVWLAAASDGSWLLPRTGQAFTAEHTGAQRSLSEDAGDPCELVVGPARSLCHKDDDAAGTEAKDTPAPGSGSGSDELGGESAPGPPAEVTVLGLSALGLGGVWMLAQRRPR
ncbi:MULTISPECIES: hypothetical protein [unclassified Streptomyces]|uniref:hypothetical protein n=1 Tax=unclassified Streptomyces TaxID=2593676 RepID=UPI002DDA8AB9|nr:hypothetical protein [Streptomyces sp. NBC_01795]WSA97753.1 hypothetical protein OIE63_40410 [Streptomyces sp. NBC_01795]WSS46730.1 hypothetical protein OG220_39810 [Streptomyces sp. NBC_01187]WSS47053.1 hypothetical protein OG220_41815 [Streptomyces sp. NBC_01187]